MVVFMSTEGHTDGGVELRDTPSCMRSEASAVLNYLPSEVLPGSSLADGYASIAGAHGRSVRHCLLLVCTGLEARTVGVVSPTSARTSRGPRLEVDWSGCILWYVCESYGRQRVTPFTCINSARGKHRQSVRV